MIIDVLTPSMTSYSGGVGVAVGDLYSNFADQYSDFINIHSLTDQGEVVWEFSNEHIKELVYSAFKPRTIGFSLDLLTSLDNFKGDVIHSHGVWMFTSFALLMISVKNGTPFVVSPHGMLDPWIMSHGRIKKYAAMLAYERSVWSRAALFHALNAREADAIKAVVPKANIVIAPNGINVSESEFVAEVISETVRFLFLGRFHPKKNLHCLVQAICSIEDEIYSKKPFILDIVGWGDEVYESKIKEIACVKPERFNFTGPKFGKEKHVILQATHCFILPSYSEGQPIAVLEAMRVGIPVLINENSNMPNYTALKLTEDCGVTVCSIKNSIIWFLGLSSIDIRLLRRASFDFVSRNYSWPVVLPLYRNMYERLLE